MEEQASGGRLRNRTVGASKRRPATEENAMQNVSDNLCPSQGHKSGVHAEAACWLARAEELARWAWDRLVNRVDVWGGYTPESERGKEYRRADGRVERLG